MKTTPRSRVLPNVRGQFPPIVQMASGVWITDTDGQRFLDGCSGAVVSNIGHGVTPVIEAMISQLRTCEFVYRSQFTSQTLEDFADTLCERAGSPVARVAFASGGSEAVETALKLAVQYWREVGQPQKSMIVGADISYHGATAAALGASGSPNRRYAFEPMLRPQPSFHAPSCSRCPVGEDRSTCSYQCLQSLEQILADQHEDIAAVIIEPVGGATRASDDPPNGYLDAMRSVCDRFNVLMICDEVMTGGYRTGPFLAQHHETARADLTILAKGLSAGYSMISAVLLGSRVDDAIEQGSGIFAHGYTHAGAPLGAAAGLAVLRYCDEQNVSANVEARSKELRTGLLAFADKYPVVRNVRGRGLLLGVELANPDGTPLNGGLSGSYAIAAAMEKHLLLVYPCAHSAISAVMVAPPLTVTTEEVSELLTRFEAGLQSLS